MVWITNQEGKGGIGRLEFSLEFTLLGSRGRGVIRGIGYPRLNKVQAWKNATEEEKNHPGSKMNYD